MKILYYILSVAYFCSCTFGDKKRTSKEIVSQKENSEYSYSCKRNGISDFLSITGNYKYPSKITTLEDIAEIKYISLETTDKSLLQGVNGIATSKDKIVICDIAQHSIFIFDNKGGFITSFKHQGSGPQEYSAIYNFCVDFQKEEIFICDFLQKNRLVTYSFNGEFIREFKFSEKIWPSVIYNYDEDFLIAYDTYEFKPNVLSNKQPYILIDKKQGKVSPLPLRVTARKSNRYSTIEGENSFVSTIHIDPMIKTKESVIISDFSLDTIYEYKKHKLIPIGVKTNFENNDLPAFSAYSNNYSLFCIHKKGIDFDAKKTIPLKSSYLLIEHLNSSIYEIRLPISDVKGSENIIWDCYGKSLHENGVAFIFQVDLLKSLLHKQRLTGDLKEITLRLSEEDNPVLMLAKFK